MKPQSLNSTNWAKPLKAHFTRYRVTVSYVGTGFAGWVSTPGHHKQPSVSETLQKAIIQFAGGDENVDNFKGSSRTDVGVHAIRNVFQVDLKNSRKESNASEKSPHPSSNVMHGINYHMKRTAQQNQLLISDVSVENDIFDARSNALARTYVYKINHIRDRGRNDGMIAPENIFQMDKAWTLRSHLDIQQMNKAGKYLLGEHDFSTFRGAHCHSVTPRRFMQQIEVVPQRSQPIDYSLSDGYESLHIYVTANSFLQRMVRNLVGVLVEVGRGNFSPEEMPKILESRDRNIWNGYIGTAPAHGLYLLNVHYDLQYLKEYNIDWKRFPPPEFVKRQLESLNIASE